MRNLLATTCLVYTMASSAFAAGPPRVVHYLDGYACAKLQMTPAEAQDYMHATVPIWSDTSRTMRGTTASSVLFVRQPLVVVNGLAEVMQVNGRPGWIATNRIGEMNPAVLCRPAQMNNGRIGVG